MESYSKKTNEKIDFPTNIDEIGRNPASCAMNSTIEKMKEGGEDRYEQIDEKIANLWKRNSPCKMKK